jgi:hypothetical protein
VTGHGRGAALILALAAAFSGVTDAPLTDEDVVRMFVAGRPAAEILDEIERRLVRFDLSDEMRSELRRAGLPEEILAAMAARQEELHPPAPTGPPSAEPGDGAARLVVRLRVAGQRQGERRLRVDATLDPGLAASWQLDGEIARAPLEDVALYLACRSATHVPDQWRDRSALGRDFVSMPRHQLLAFVSGAVREDGERRPATLVLEVPETITAVLEPEEAHDLSVGIALRAGGRYYRLLDAAQDGVRPVEGTIELSVVVQSDRRGATRGLGIAFEPPRTDDETPAP